MQLFVTDYKIKDKDITIENIDILNQVRKVLRLKKWDIIYVQNSWENKTIRYEIEITDWNDKVLFGKILNEEEQIESDSKISSLIISMPNKRDKIELIVQKLTEIGIDKIIFWPSERSQIKEWNEKKYERLLKISKEAVEQSRWWKSPEIIFTKEIKDYIKDKEVIVFDKTNEEAEINNDWNIVWLVGPEWWLTERDYKQLDWVNYKLKWLWETILRTETASIVGWWILKNLS